MRYLCLYKPARNVEEGVPPSQKQMAEMGRLIAGFALIQAMSKEEAIERTRRFLEVAGDGESEIRHVYDSSDCASV